MLFNRLLGGRSSFILDAKCCSDTALIDHALPYSGRPVCSKRSFGGRSIIRLQCNVIPTAVRIINDERISDKSCISSYIKLTIPLDVRSICIRLRYSICEISSIEIDFCIKKNITMLTGCTKRINLYTVRISSFNP